MPLLAERVAFSAPSIRKVSRKRSRSSSDSYLLDLLEELWNSYYPRFQLYSKRQEQKKSATLSKDLKLVQNSLFGCPSSLQPFSVRALLECLHCGNKEHDSVAWLITFVLFDRLIFSLDTELRTNNSFILNIFYPEFSVHTLFTLYCISFKWHLDYTVSLKYLVDLLPCSSDNKKYILQRTVALERLFLTILNFCCNVSRKEILDILEFSLLPDDASALSNLLL